MSQSSARPTRLRFMASSTIAEPSSAISCPQGVSGPRTDDPAHSRIPVGTSVLDLVSEESENIDLGVKYRRRNVLW